MISFVLLFAVAFAALPTTKQTCEAVPGAKWTPTDGSATEGTCGCDTGFTVDGDKCKCTAADQFIIKTDNNGAVTYGCAKCTDPAKKYYDPTELKCTDFCPTKYGPNAQNVCESCGNKKYLAQGGVCADACSENMDETDGSCSCKEGYNYYKEDKKCYKQCPEMTSDNSGHCMKCGTDNLTPQPKWDTQLKDCTGACAEGATETTDPSGMKKCTCPANQYPILVTPEGGSSTLKCQACAANTVFVLNDKACKAKATCKVSESYDQETNTCGCGQGMEANTGADKETKPCKCKADNMIKEGDNYVCKKCEGATPKYDAANFKCVKADNNGVNGLFVVLAMAIFFLF